MRYLILFLTAFIFSMCLTGIVRKFALSRGLLDKPRERDVHQSPMPRIGGLAIFLAFMAVSVITFAFIFPAESFGQPFLWGLDKRLLGIWAGALVITGTMLFDDLFGLKVWQKLGSQILVALILIASGIGIDHLTNPFGGEFNLNSIYIPLLTYEGVTYHFSLLSDVLTLIWIVGMMNVVNFVDGVDGLASGQAAIAAITIFLLSLSPLVNQPATAMLAIILAGAAAGFLLWNFPPAKIFMGDSGSMFLGFLLGALPLISGGKLATAFLVLGFPIIDGVFVAASRLIKGKNPMTTPDKTHLHHRFLRAGFSRRQAVCIIYFISAAFGWVALRSTTQNKVIAAGVLAALLFGLVALLTYQGKKRAVISDS